MSQPVVVETASLTVICPPHDSVEEREAFIQQKVHEAVNQRVATLHEAPHVGTLKVEILDKDDLNRSVASDDSSNSPTERTDSYATAMSKPLHI
eukprot:m.20254 g.20254  ORF g.20254 m.20254 type:complete len:94 (-) comp10164_c0_seq1:230-511(-)